MFRNYMAEDAVRDYRLYIERDTCVRSYENAFGMPPSIQDIKETLKGKNLACWCRLCDKHKDGKPFGEVCTDCKPCHVDVLGEISNGLKA